jgi:hypothetical protein
VRPHVYGGKKGRYTVALKGGRTPSEDQLIPLAKQYREMHGVKRAIVRGSEIYVRVDVRVRRMRQNLKVTAYRYCRKFGQISGHTPHGHRKGHYGPPPSLRKKRDFRPAFIPTS